MITANNPQAAHNLVIYNFVDKEFKGVPGGADEHVAYHLSIAGHSMHTESEDAADQRAFERAYKAAADERRRERIRAAQEEGTQRPSAITSDQPAPRSSYGTREPHHPPVRL